MKSSSMPRCQIIYIPQPIGFQAQFICSLCDKKKLDLQLFGISGNFSYMYKLKVGAGVRREGGILMKYRQLFRIADKKKM